MRSPIVVLVLSLIFSGCTSPEAASAQQAPLASDITPTNAPEPIVDAENGAIAGTVTDEELVPIAAAAILLDGTGGSNARASPEGRFAFSSIAPGTHQLVVEAPGYAGSAQPVAVVAGETTEVKVVLARLAPSVVRNVTYIAEGYIDITWSIPGFYGYNETKANRQIFVYPVDGNVSTVVSAAAWQSSAPLTAKNMQMWLYVGSKTCSTDRSHCAEGGSPIVNRWDGVQVPIRDELNRTKTPQTIGVGLTPLSCDPDACPGQPDIWAQVAFQQHFTLYTSVFWVQAPDETFTPLPPSLFVD